MKLLNLTHNESYTKLLLLFTTICIRISTKPHGMETLLQLVISSFIVENSSLLVTLLAA